MIKVFAKGRLTKDWEIRTGKSGKVYGSNSIAINRKQKDENGNYITDFFNIKAFDKTAETLSKNFKKGNRILIEGILQDNTSTDANGNIKHYIEIIVNEFEFIDKKEQKEDTTKTNEEFEFQEGELPF